MDHWQWYALGVATPFVVVLLIWFLLELRERAFIGRMLLYNRWDHTEHIALYSFVLFGFGLVHLSKLADHHSMSITLARQRKQIIKVWGRMVWEFKTGTLMVTWPRWFDRCLLRKNHNGIAHKRIH